MFIVNKYCTPGPLSRALRTSGRGKNTERNRFGVGLLATQGGAVLTSLTTSDSFSGISTKKSTRVDDIPEIRSDLSELSDATGWEEGEL